MREIYRRLAQSPDSSLTALGVLLSVSTVVDQLMTAASLRLSNADGSFAGIVTAPLDQSYFTKLYRSIDLGKNGTIFLMHREGRLLAREPEDRGSVGKSLADSPLLAKY